MSAIVRFFRFFCFVVFFIVGAGAISISLLVGEINEYYVSQRSVERTRAQNAELAELLKDYDMRIYQVRTNPDHLKKLQRITLGIEPHAEDTIFPQASAAELLTVEQVLARAERGEESTIQPPAWVLRCLEKRFRYALFLAGLGLIMVNFIFFGQPGPYADPKKTPEYID